MQEVETLAVCDPSLLYPWIRASETGFLLPEGHPNDAVKASIEVVSLAVF